MTVFKPPSNPKCRWIGTLFSVIKPGGVFRFDRRFWIKLNTYSATKYHGHYNFGETINFSLTENVMTFPSQTRLYTSDLLDQENPFLIKKVQTQVQQPNQ